MLGRVHAISHRGKYSISVYTDTGTTSFSHTVTEFRKGNHSTSSANYSVDGDAVLHRRRGGGDYAVHMIDTRTIWLC